MQTNTLPNLNRKIVKIANVSLIALGALPCIFVAALLTYAIRASFYLGHLPRPHFPDPKSLPFELHYAFVEALMFAVIYGSGLPLLLAFTFGRFTSKSLQRKWLKIFSVGWVSIVLLAFIRPFDFLMWFLD